MKSIHSIANIKKNKAELKDTLKIIEEKTSVRGPMPPKYATAEELSDMMLNAIKGSIEKMWPSATTPRYLDR